MIPKVIHYCWLSGDPFPAKIRRCMDSRGKVMPDYAGKLWNTDNFDVMRPVAREAYERRKWAFAADYIRIYALYTEGGTYLDSDVKVLKRFDDFLPYPFFSSVEYHPRQIERDHSAIRVDTDGTPRLDSLFPPPRSMPVARRNTVIAIWIKISRWRGI